MTNSTYRRAELVVECGMECDYTTTVPWSDRVDGYPGQEGDDPPSAGDSMESPLTCPDCDDAGRAHSGYFQVVEVRDLRTKTSDMPPDHRDSDLSPREKAADILAHLYAQKALGMTPEEIQAKRNAEANMFDVSGLRSPHPGMTRQALAVYRAGEYAAGESTQLGPDDGMMAVEYGPYATREDDPDSLPVSVLALKFPSPEQVVVVHVGMLEPNRRWVAFPADPDGERPDGPTTIPRDIVGRYFYELGQPAILATEDAALPYKVFREPDISDREDPPIYHGSTHCDRCGNKTIPRNNSREYAGNYLCDSCSHDVLEGDGELTTDGGTRMCRNDCGRPARDDGRDAFANAFCSSECEVRYDVLRDDARDARLSSGRDPIPPGDGGRDD